MSQQHRRPFFFPAHNKKLLIWLNIPLNKWEHWRREDEAKEASTSDTLLYYEKQQKPGNQADPILGIKRVWKPAFCIDSEM